MRLFIREVYKTCAKLKNHKTLHIQRIIMGKHLTMSSSSSLGEKNPKEIMEIPNPGCVSLKNDYRGSEPAFYKLDSKENCIDLENTKSASKINNYVGGRPPLRPSSTEEQQPIMIFYFDLETSGLDIGCDILEISVRSGDTHFSSFVSPTQPIDVNASRVNNLYVRDGDLYKDNEKLETLPLNVVLGNMIDHLANLNKKCVLVAHNCPFDSRHLLRKLQDNSILFDKFEKLIYGFVDSLEMFADMYPERRWKKGALTLSRLVKESLGLSTTGVHDATVDTYFLEKLVQHHFKEEQILRYRVTLAYALENHRNWSKKKKSCANTA